MSMMGTPRAETEDQAKLRFQIELEFVQCLANPNYLNFLAQRGHLKEPSFINYLKYLEYWKESDYAKFLKYPMSLYFLDLLQHPEFRKEIANNKCAKFVEDQQLLHWQHYIRKRSKLAPPPPVPSTVENHGSTSGSTATSTVNTTTSTSQIPSAPPNTPNVNSMSGGNKN